MKVNAILTTHLLGFFICTTGPERSFRNAKVFFLYCCQLFGKSRLRFISAQPIRVNNISESQAEMIWMRLIVRLNVFPLKISFFYRKQYIEIGLPIITIVCVYLILRKIIQNQ